MTTPLDDRNSLAMEMLVACDQSYIYDLGKVQRVHNDTQIAPLPDSAPENEAALPYTIPDTSFKVREVIQDFNTGFKCLVYKSDIRNEVIVAMAGTDGLNMQDWAQNLKWGWLQWSADNKKAVFDAITAAGGPSATTIHFTGQSLGGALAEYAAFDFWREHKDLENPADLLNRMTLTTFNGLAGGAAISQFGGATAAELVAFRPAQTAHYEVANDFIHRLGGVHVGGNGTMYKLNFTSDKGDPRTGQPLLLSPVDAHRIESSFYRQFGKQLSMGDNRLFNQAVPYADFSPIPVDGLQAEPGAIIFVIQ